MRSGTGPLVSVVVVCFNHARFVTECLDGIAAQTYANTEFFVIDNGSTDDSLEVIERHPHLHRFQLVRNSNIGLVSALNQMRGAVRGKYICIISADDFWTEPRKIELQVDLMEREPTIGVCSAYMIKVDEQSRETGRHPRDIRSHDVSVEELLLYRYYFPGLVTMIRTEAIDSVNWFRTEFGIEDYQLWLAIASHGWRLHCMGQIMGAYRRHGSNVSKNVEFMRENRRKILELYRSSPHYSAAIDVLESTVFLSYSRSEKRRAIQSLRNVRLTRHTVRPLAKGLVYLVLPPPLIRRLRLDY